MFSNMKVAVVVVFLLSTSFTLVSPQKEVTDDWLMTARITTPLSYDTTWEEGVSRAVQNHANVLLDWAGFSDSYRGTILETDASLAALQQRVDYVHKEYPAVKYMVYIAPLEMITYNSDLDEDGSDDDGAASTYTDHPDWMQMGIDGRRAVFYGSMPGMPFWVAPTSEDVWISPSNPEYRTFILDLARRIALTGIDAVWFDVPHLSFDFGDRWQNQWCSIDPASRSAFFNHTGLQLSIPPFQPDWDNPIWHQFVLWRYRQILDFIYDFNLAIKAGNPDCKLVIETSSSSVLITQHGCDLIELPRVCDAIAHEYTGPYTEWQHYSWLHMLATLKFWHDLDVNSSWLLSYVQQGKVELGRYHAALVSMMGYNYYTSGNIGMAGIVDEAFMRELFSWLDRYGDYYYGWESVHRIALVYSQQTLDFLDRGQWSGYAYHDEFLGVMMMLLASNVPFEVLTDRELARCHEYDMVILDDVACMSPEQASILRGFVADGGTLLVINETSLYTSVGEKREDFLLFDVLGVHADEVDEKTIYHHRYGDGRCIFTLFPLGRSYIWEATPWADHGNQIAAEHRREQFLGFIRLGNPVLPFTIDGQAIVIPVEKEGVKALQILNLAGIQKGNAVPYPQEVQVTLKEAVDNVSVLGFMDGFGIADLRTERDTTVITVNLDIQSVLVIGESGGAVYADIIQPQAGTVYLMGRELMHVSSNATIIIGPITINAATNGNMIEFYIDDELKFTDVEVPFEWPWDEHIIGTHSIRVVAYNHAGDSHGDSQTVWILNP